MLLLLLSIITSAHAAYYEVSANFWQNRQVYGASKDSSNLSQVYSTGVAWYVWQLTALEFMAQRQRNLITENDPVDTAGGDQVVSSRNEVVTDTFSLGVKQALTSPKARIIPAVTMGYAKQILQGRTRYVVQQSGSVEQFTVEDDRRTQDSCFAGVSLRLRLTEFSGITGSYRSIMPNCDTDMFSDNTQFSTGLSWMF